MKTIAVINIKGGVGKTISAVNIAAILNRQGKKVLLADLDAQANATQLLNCYGKGGYSISDAFLIKDFSTEDIILHTDYENLDIIPSDINFAFAESKIIVDTARPQQTRLRKALKQVDELYDFCLLDCPPDIGVITINALAAADYVIVPIMIDSFALEGLDNLISTIMEIKEEFNENLRFLGCFVTMDNFTSVNREIKRVLREQDLFKMFTTTIKRNTKVPESTFKQAPVVFTAPKSAASINYIELTQELLDRIEEA